MIRRDDKPRGTARDANYGNLDTFEVLTGCTLQFAEREVLQVTFAAG